MIVISGHSTLIAPHGFVGAQVATIQPERPPLFGSNTHTYLVEFALACSIVAIGCGIASIILSMRARARRANSL